MAIRSPRSFALVAVVGAGLAVLVAPGGAAAPSSALPGDPVWLMKNAWTSTATAISGSGRVAGFGTTTESGNVRKAFASTAAGGGSYLPAFGSKTVEALGVNDAGVAVGDAFVAPNVRRAFRGGSLLAEVEGQNDAYAQSINSANQTVGAYRDAQNIYHAVLWGPDGRPKPLSTGPHSRANAINESGTIVGDFNQRACVFDGEGGVQMLPDLGGSESFARDVNDSGTIVGAARTPGGIFHAVLWKDGVLTDLEPGSPSHSFPTAVNNAGVVVGGFTGDPVMWDAFRRRKRLNCLLPAGSKWVLNVAHDINDSGVVVGEGRLIDGRSRLAFAFKPDPNAVCPGSPPFIGVQGVVEFEKVPVTTRGLRLAEKRRVAVVGVTVDAVRAAAPTEVVGSAVTDYQGHFEIPLSVTESVRLRVRSVMGNVEVERPDTGDPYEVLGAAFTPDPAGTVTQNVLATDATRASGPFNILDVARRCVAFVRRYDSALQPPPLVFRWSEDRSDGSFFVDNPGAQTDVIHVNGSRAVNSDEFDDTVLAHEYGHFLARAYSRDDTFGGFHVIGQRLDPRVAWSEGWATFFGCAAMGTSLKIDSYGSNGRRARTRKVEKNTVPGDTPGISSEHSVSSALWDLADPVADTGDSIALGFGPIWTAFKGGMKDERFTYLLDFCDVLVRDDPTRGPAIAAVLSARRVTYSPGTTPVSPVAFPAPVASSASVSGVADSFTLAQANLSTSSRLFEFTLAATGAVSVNLNWTSIDSGPSDLDLFLLDRDGNEINRSANGPGTNTEAIDVASLAAGSYVIEVKSFSDDNAGGKVFNRGRFTLTATY